MERALAVYSFGAIGAVDRVLDVLCTDENEAHAFDRSAAVVTLRRWIGRDQANGPLLYNEQKGTGLLIGGQHLHDLDAKTVFVLLHDFPSKDLRQPATFDKLASLLRDPHLPIRELAYWHLLKLSAGAGEAAGLQRRLGPGPAEQRRGQVEEEAHRRRPAAENAAPGVRRLVPTALPAKRNRSRCKLFRRERFAF